MPCQSFINSLTVLSSAVGALKHIADVGGAVWTLVRIITEDSDWVVS